MASIKDTSIVQLNLKSVSRHCWVMYSLFMPCPQTHAAQIHPKTQSGCGFFIKILSNYILSYFVGTCGTLSALPSFEAATSCCLRCRCCRSFWYHRSWLCNRIKFTGVKMNEKNYATIPLLVPLCLNGQSRATARQRSNSNQTQLNQKQ